MFKSFLTIVTLFIIAGSAISQNLNIQAGSNYTGSGTYNVKGNINNTEAKAISGTVNLIGVNQNIGTGGNGALTFEKLNSQGSGTKTQNVVVNVSTAFTIAGTGSFDINGQTLNLDGTCRWY